MKRDYLHSIASVALTAAVIALATPAMAQHGGGRHFGGNNGGNRSSSSMSSTPSSSNRPSSSMRSMPSSLERSSMRVERSTPTTVNQHRDVVRSTESKRFDRPSGNDRPQIVNHGGNDRPRGGSGSGSGSGFNRGGNNDRPNHGGTGSGYNRPNGNDRPNGGRNWNRPNGNDRPNVGNNWNRQNRNGNNRPGGNNWNHGGNNRPGGNNWNRPGNSGRPGGDMRPGGPHHGINHGGPRPDYNRYRYSNGFRPRHRNDRWFDYYRYNRWSWHRPVLPPHRPWRPRIVWYYRPVIPVGYRFYASAPIITGILGLEFGTYLDASLNYLYYNGYNIDGYQDNVVYLRDVQMLGYSWPDVMLQYNDGGGLSYAEFAVSSNYQDQYRYNALYNNLCSTYGTPIESGNGHVSWYGGNGTGFVNLNFAYEGGRYYTVLTFGA